MEFNRGQTVYDGAGNALKGAIHNASALIYEWKCLQSCRDSREKVKVKKSEAQRLSSFENLLHNAER